MSRGLLLAGMIFLVTGCSGTGYTARIGYNQPKLTPAEDAAISQQVRKAILSDQTMSINAQNVYVKSNNGVVVIRGAVDDALERSKVLDAARRIASVRSIRDEMETLIPDLAAKEQDQPIQ